MSRSLCGHTFLLFMDKCLRFGLLTVYLTLGEMWAFPMWEFQLSQILNKPGVFSVCFLFSRRCVVVSYFISIPFNSKDKHLFLYLLALHIFQHIFLAHYSLVKCCSYLLMLFILIEIFVSWLICKTPLYILATSPFSNYIFGKYFSMCSFISILLTVSFEEQKYLVLLTVYDYSLLFSITAFCVLCRKLWLIHNFLLILSKMFVIKEYTLMSMTMLVLYMVWGKSWYLLINYFKYGYSVIPVSFIKN